MKTIEGQLHCEYEKAEFAHAGDLGDIIWGSAAIRLWMERNAPGERATLYLYDAPGCTTHPMTPERVEVVGSLLSAQPWLRVVHSPVPVHSDFNGFRDHGRSWKSIGGMHLGALGFAVGDHTAAVERRWLDVPAPLKPVPKEWQVVFVRTHRYRSHDFMWPEIIDWFGHSAVFLGHEQEYADWVKDHPRGAAVPHCKTENLLKAAQIIDAAKLFVSNQTALFGVAEALKKPRILETWTPLTNCEYGSRNCLALHPGTKVSGERILELMSAPFSV